MAGPTQSCIPPLDPPYEPDVEDMLRKWMPPGAGVEPLKLFRVLAQNQELMSRMRPLGAGILGKTSLIDPREREIVIDRTCARCSCEYEWGVHAASFGPAFNISREKLDGTVRAAADDPCWSPREALLIRLVDALHDSAHLPDDLWEQIRQEWNTPQLLELIIMVGWYHVIAYVANASGIPPEAWAARFPDA